MKFHATGTKVGLHNFESNFAMARTPKWLEAMLSEAAARALLDGEPVDHYGPNDCWLSKRATAVGAYPRRQLTKEELPDEMDDADREEAERNKAIRKVSLHVVAARVRGLDVQAGDVSHRCGRGQRTAYADRWGCINPRHVLIEAHALNMRRLNCLIDCPHCDEYICPHGGALPADAAGRPAVGKTTDHSGCLA